MPPEVRAGVTPKVKADKPLGQWNRFVITMKGDRLTVVLNGKTVIENAQLPGVPPTRADRACSTTATRSSSRTCSSGSWIDRARRRRSGSLRRRPNEAGRFVYIRELD